MLYIDEVKTKVFGNILLPYMSWLIASTLILAIAPVGKLVIKLLLSLYIKYDDVGRCWEEDSKNIEFAREEVSKLAVYVW